MNTYNSNLTVNTNLGTVNTQYMGRQQENTNSQDNNIDLGENGKATEQIFINAIEKANRMVSGSTECQFSVHKQTKQIIIKLIDPQTKEVIKEIPSEKILDMVANMCELAGLFVDEKK